MTKKANNQQPEVRALPTSTEVQQAIQWLHDKEPEPVPRTIIMKVRNPSRQSKVPRLLRTHIYVTNLKHKILEHYRENLETQRDDGAIALVLRVQNLGSGRSKKMASIISSEYLQPTLTDEDYRFHARIRDGVCREVATTLLNWVQDSTGTLLSATTLQKEDETTSEQQEKKPSAAKNQQKRSTRKQLSRNKRKQPITLDEAYAAWKQQRQRWEQAAAIPIPFGKYGGTPLGEIGRREALWLMERLLPTDEIEEMLTCLEHLLETPYPASDLLYEEHIYQRDGGREFKHRRAVRANRLVQRVLDPPGELILLGMLHRNELQTLRNELLLMKQAGEQFESLLPPLQEALQEAQQLAEFSDFPDQTFKHFREVFETFLYEKPADYPEIAEGTCTEEQRAELEEIYQTRLQWFRPNPKRKDDVEKYIEEKRESGARDRLLKAAGDLVYPALQPIPFIGAMRPESYHVKKRTITQATSRDFALLFDQETQEFVVAIWLRGSKDPLTYDERLERREKQQQQKHHGRLVYANFPETPFGPSDRTPYMLLPLEWGEHSQRKRFQEKRQPMLLKLIEQQRQRQRDFHASISTEDHPIPIEQCLPPEVPFKTARLVMQWSEQNTPVFFLHVSVAFPTSRPKQVPQTVIGFHEQETGYSFAEVHLDGTLIRVGDLTIPRHVDPACGAKRSDNYQYEVVHAMLREAGTAYIGIEDTRYRKDQVSLSRQDNRAVFGRPSGRIRETLETKGRECEKLPPRAVSNIAPGRDCSICHVCHPKHTSCHERRQMVRCPNEECKTWQVWQDERAEQHCAVCHQNWQIEPDDVVSEWYFVCPTCQQSALPARYNTAAVVAQETLREMKRHWKNGLDYEKRKEQQGKTK
jgi:uncharacterized protein (DUF3820 family)